MFGRNMSLRKSEAVRERRLKVLDNEKGKRRKIRSCILNIIRLRCKNSYGEKKVSVSFSGNEEKENS